MLTRAALFAAALLLPAPLGALELCQGFGPQTPRNIGDGFGTNMSRFAIAPPPEEMNLCNIHTHTNAEHMGPGFAIWAGPGDHGGFKCSGSKYLSDEERGVGKHADKPVKQGKAREKADHGGGAFGGVHPGDTIEVLWVYSTCNVQPGPGLGACLSEGCANPQLRVESQVFLVVEDDVTALDFADFTHAGTRRHGRPQPRALPTGTGNPVVFRGSTTGPKYSEAICSPLQVTWSVRPRCAKLRISSLHAWAANGNVFGETHSHGVRQLVTAPELLAPMD